MTSNFLVIGSGLAGLVFALDAAQHGRVAILCKAEAAVSNTAMAQGGIAAVLSESDSFDQHVQDTLAAGAGLCNRQMVELLVREAPAAISYLQQLGVPFVTADGSLPDLHLEGGHTYHRIVHVHDKTGQYIQQSLLKAATQNPNISFFENHLAIDLLSEPDTNGEPVCNGAMVLDVKQQQLKHFFAGKVLLATGGLGQIYQHTTNPYIATGDGVAIAHRAGAKTAHLEFMQFHPTALYSPGYAGTFLISEAVRGAGAELRNAAGEAFMQRQHPLGSLAPRDVVARAIAAEMESSGNPCVYLDLSEIPEEKIREQFPAIYKTCLSRGIDITCEQIPVLPAAHYACGGVVTNSYAQTNITGLYAAGEVACTGVHGANRLASNSLLEAVVFGRRAAAHAAAYHSEMPALQEHKSESVFGCLSSYAVAAFIHEQKGLLQQLMWQHAGIVRTKPGLSCCLQWIEEKQYELSQRKPLPVLAEWLELQNMMLVARLVVSAALNRNGSVGGHYVVEMLDLQRCGLQESGAGTALQYRTRLRYKFPGGDLVRTVV